jgi:tetratricopeptide (TPR) repeat protein
VPRLAQIAAALARRPAVLAAGLVALAAGWAAGALPLLETPGWELGEACTVAALAAAPFLSLAAVRLERARPDPSAASAWGAAALVTVALSALLAAGAIARAARGPCHAAGAALAFVPLLTVPSALLAAAVAVLAALVARGRAPGTGLLYTAALVASLAWTLRVAYAGPAAFAFDPFLGAWPGPLYDEALRVDARTLLFRVEAAALAVAVLAVAEMAVRLGREREPRPVGSPALALVVAAFAALALHAARDGLGVSGTRAVLARALGGRLEGPRCTLVFPAEKPRAAAEALLAQCAFEQADVASALGIAAPPHVTVYVYRSAAEKRSLVGAGATEYAKPWLAEIHLADAALPHPVLRHEMVHAVAGALAGGLLHVPARAGVLPSAGLVEGLAVALDLPRGAWTVHEWSRAARDLGLLPDVTRIVGPAGFWTQAPARAYTAAGSFLAFLLERRGPGPVARAYRTGDLAGALGAPLEALAADWQRFLDGVEVPPGLRAAARERLGRGSVFARPCAREIATLELDAARAYSAGRTGEACALWERVAARPDPDGAAAEKAIGDALARGGDLDAAERAYRSADARAPEDDAALRTALAAARGDLAWRRGDAAAAEARWSEALARHPDRPEARLLEAKRLAASDPELGPPARGYLLGDGDPGTALARVAAVPRPLASYLLGRALLQRGETAAAVPELERGAAGGLPPDLALEARLLSAEARCLSGETGSGAAALARALAEARGAADRVRIEAARRRCAFELERPAASR